MTTSAQTGDRPGVRVPPQELKRRVLTGETLYGTFAGLGSPIAVEAVAAAGLDWVLLDLEHGGGGEDFLGAGVLAARSRDTPVIARIEAVDRIRAGRALDLGVEGIMFPRVTGADHARLAVSYLHYPTQGVRGVATYNRQGSFGLDPGILRSQSDTVLGLIQIETAESLADIDSIAAVDGVDVLFIGPVDLSYALGVPLEFDTPVFQDALDQVVAAADRAGKCPGIMASTPRLAADYARRGFRFISLASDASLLATTMRAALLELPR